MEPKVSLGKRIGYISLKSFIFLVLFAILHYLYFLSPNPFFQIISGTDESVFQHLKMGFIGYLFLIGIDYVLIRFMIKRGPNVNSFVFSRLLSSLLVPWMIFAIWYIVPAIVGGPISFAAELTWALSVVLIIGIIISFIDENTEKIEYNLAAKIIIVALVIVSLAIFIVFSFVLPWIDVFVLPTH